MSGIFRPGMRVITSHGDHGEIDSFITYATRPGDRDERNTPGYRTAVIDLDAGYRVGISETSLTDENPKPGFHGNVATSHLPKNVKLALLGHETNIRCGKIEFDDNGHVKYTEQEFSAMSRVWAQTFIDRHPHGRNFRAELHTMTPAQHDAHRKHLDHFLRLLGQAQGENPTPITVPGV